MEFNLKEVARRIRDLREATGYTQEELARLTGVTAEDYRVLEAGESAFSFTFIYKCAKACGVEVTDILEGTSATLTSFAITRRGEGLKIVKKHGYVYNNLAPKFKDKLAEPFLVKFPYLPEEQDVPIKLSSHNGQEFDVIVKGSTSVLIAGQPAARLGDMGIEPVELSAKEGLALNDGTQMLTAVGLNTLWDAMHLAKVADIACAMTDEALHAITAAYDPKIQDVRGHQGQKESAANLLDLLAGSCNAQRTQETKVQDPYTLRCTPQIHGASRDAFRYVYDAVTTEINAVTDNPIIFPDDDEVISGGNFHGQPMALAFDFMKMAISELADVSERRIERLVNPALSEGLPPFLTKHAGVCSGFMITQYAAASLVSENKVYDHPACVDSIPSSGNQEDHVSMGMTSARTAAMVLDNTEKVLAIEIGCAAQAIWLRQEIGENQINYLSPAMRAAYEHVRAVSDPVDEDVIMHDELVKFEQMVKDGSLLAAVEKVIPLR